MEGVKGLCRDWIEAKKAEAAANAKRVAIEAKLIEVVGAKKVGSQTTNESGFKVVTTGKENTKLNFDEWEKVKDQFPVEMRPIKTKEELDESGVKWLKENKPELYKLLPIEITPAKTSVKIELVDPIAAGYATEAQ